MDKSLFRIMISAAALVISIVGFVLMTVNWGIQSALILVPTAALSAYSLVRGWRQRKEKDD